MNSGLITWTDSLSVGHDAIDSDHKAFIELVGFLSDFNLESGEGGLVFESALSILEEYVFGHFFREECAMKKGEYRHYVNHKRQHDAFREKVIGIIKEYRNGVTSAVASLPSLVSQWLLHHIAHEDMKLKLALGSDAVDGRPLAFLAEDAYEEFEFEKISAEYVNKPAKELDYSKVSAVVCEQGSIVRRAIRLSLSDLGITRIEDANTIPALHGLIMNGDYQIAILNHTIDSLDTTTMLQDMRRMKIGRDPFVVAAMLITSGDQDVVRKAVNSGADTVLLLPFSAEQFKKKLTAQIECRRPFVVTRDYVGPERRNEARPDKTSAVQIPVPNPVHARGLGLPVEEYDAMVKAAAETIGIAHVKSISAAIQYECDKLLAGIRDGTIGDGDKRSGVFSIDMLTEELHTLAKASFKHLSHGVAGFRMQVELMKGKVGNLSYVDAGELSASWREFTKSSGIK